MKNIILSHNDLDGYGVNVIANVIEKTNPQIKFHIENCSYKSINLHGYRVLAGTEQFSELNVKTCDNLFITDITMSDKMMAWADKFKNVICLDHHFTTKQYLSDLYKWCKIEELDEDSDRTSGTLMFYKYVKKLGWLDNLTFEQDMNLSCFAHTVRDYDLWIWAENEDVVPKNLNDIFGFMDREEFIHKQSESILNYGDFIEENKVVIETLNKIYSNYKRSKIENIKEYEPLNKKFGFRIGVLFADQYISELGNDLCKETDYDAILMINADKGICSIRSVGDINVGDMAKELGGGGHFNSSGFNIDEKELFERVLNLIK